MDGIKHYHTSNFAYEHRSRLHFHSLRSLLHQNSNPAWNLTLPLLTLTDQSADFNINICAVDYMQNYSIILKKLSKDDNCMKVTQLCTHESFTQGGEFYIPFFWEY